MITPVYLENLDVPPERIAEVSAFNRFHRMERIEDLVRKVAWHEAGHAAAWALNGGTLARATIVPDGNEHGVLWGLVEYDMRDEPSTEERHRKALAGMGGPAICELAGDPDIDAIGEDLAGSVDDLRAIYSDSAELYDQAVQLWIEVLKFFGTPQVWRTADAFARKLISRGTVEGFPDDCISSDNSTIPGLEEALARALGASGSRQQHDWMLGYVTDDWDLGRAMDLQSGIVRHFCQSIKSTRRKRLALPPLGNVEVSKNRGPRSDDNWKDVGGEVPSKVIRRIAKPFNDEGPA